MSNLAFCIASSPDISGIGIRAAVYTYNLLSFIPAIYALLDKKVTPAKLDILATQSTTILLIAFAILLSTIIQASTLGLTNYHATIILNLSWINNTSTFIYLILYNHHLASLLQAERGRSSKNSNRGATPDWVYKAKKASRNPVLIIGSLHLSLMAAVGIWLWSQPAAFSGSPSCSLSTSVVILGRSVTLASKGLRDWSILIYTLLLIPGLNLAGFFLIPYLVYNCLTRWLRNKSHLIFIGSGLTILVAINIIFLVDTEVAIKRNAPLVEGDVAAWTFGQTLALLLLLLPIRRIVETIHGQRPKQLGKELLTASEKGPLDIVKGLVEQGADINAKNLGGKSALLLAARKQQWGVVKFLVECHSDVDVKDEDGATVLLIAASEGNFELVRVLVEHGADINMKDQRDRTPLQVAASLGHLDMVRYLVEHGADVNAKDGLLSPHSVASSLGHLDIVKFLQEHGDYATV